MFIHCYFLIHCYLQLLKAVEIGTMPSDYKHSSAENGMLRECKLVAKLLVGPIFRRVPYMPSVVLYVALSPPIQVLRYISNYLDSPSANAPFVFISYRSIDLQIPLMFRPRSYLFWSIKQLPVELLNLNLNSNSLIQLKFYHISRSTPS